MSACNDEGAVRVGTVFVPTRTKQMVGTKTVPTLRAGWKP